MFKRFTRRQFVALTCLGGVGGTFWILRSEGFAARFIRERCAEFGKRIRLSAFKPTPSNWHDVDITASWIGHSTVLLNFYGFTILTDPVLFSRVGADVGFGTLGPKRFIAPALSRVELPKIDLVLLSHAHLDHLDLPSLNGLPNPAKVVTARNTRDLLYRTKLQFHRELGWGEQTIVKTENGELQVEAFEVNHWGGRWSHKETRGWNGYILSRGGKKVIFGGDTAQCDNFRNLRNKGPFELAIMPIGAYNPWIQAHCTPEEAVAMANAAGAKYLLPVHHQTFALGREGFTEPIERFEGALVGESERIALRDVGETFRIC